MKAGSNCLSFDRTYNRKEFDILTHDEWYFIPQLLLFFVLKKKNYGKSRPIINQEEIELLHKDSFISTVVRKQGFARDASGNI